MPHFDEFGRDTVLCQKCHEVVTEANWRPDITGSESAGNVCADCEKKFEESKPKQAEEIEEIVVVRKTRGKMPQLPAKTLVIKEGDSVLNDKGLLANMREMFDGKAKVKTQEEMLNEVHQIGPITLPPEPPSGLAALILGDRQRVEAGRSNAPHLIVRARAGTGKTTNIIESLNRVFGMPDVRLVLSPQQGAVCEAIRANGQRPRSVCFSSFGNAITQELKHRLPKVRECQAWTMHAYGYQVVRKAFKLTGDPTDGNRCREIIAELLQVELRSLRKEKPVLLKAAVQLVGLCKQNLTPLGGNSEQSIHDLINHYDVDVGEHRQQLYDLVPRVIERCKDLSRDGYVDFDDMVWLPVVLKLTMFVNDLMVVDECQDLNRCQYELAKMAGRRLVFVGDDRQSIYGFAGAGNEMLDYIYQDLKKTSRGCEVLPLTVTRRCGKAIVEQAREIVPDFEAHESNPEGRVSSALYPVQKRRERYSTSTEVLPDAKTYRPLVRDGDMVLCRANAPLVKECFAFIKAGRRATIQGRNIGDQLVALIDRLVQRTDPTNLLVERLADWLAHELARERAERNPSEQKMENLQDRHDCLRCFCDQGTSTAEQVVAKIESLFTDDGNTAGIRLSSIHRAKGLESRRVFYIRGFGRPMDKIKTAWERKQEENLVYVAVTRAIKELIYVDGGGN